MASSKRKVPAIDMPDSSKKLKVYNLSSSLPKLRVVLNPVDCDLDFNIKDNGLQGSAMYEQGFAYCWSGARANIGITGGKYCFGCKIISEQPVDMEDTSPEQQHVCRIGISRWDDPVGNLGESDHSFGFGGTGKFSNAGKFLDYGEKFGVGDTIVCAVNLEKKPFASIGFFKNGKWLGVAKSFDTRPSGLRVVKYPMERLQWESTLFPHVMLKNVVVQLQFSVEDGLVVEEGYKSWASAIEDGNATIGPVLSDVQECEVMMMVGLPASGKTTWAEKWGKDHPEKRYVLLGTNAILDRMKVPGLLRKHNYGGRFERLMDRATAIFNTLLTRAANIPRNYIIDQTNVYKSARKRKLKPFAFFHKVAVVVVTAPEELKVRSYKRFQEMGKEVPAEAVNDMLANFVLPVSKDMHGSDEYFDQVIFAELNREESQRILDVMKRSLQLKSNLNSQNVLSPYSRENPCSSNGMQPYSEASAQNFRDSTAAGGAWEISSHNAFHNYHTPYQVPGTSGAVRSQPQANLGNASYPPQRAPNSYGTHSSTYESSLYGDNGTYYGSNHVVPRVGPEPYQGYRAGELYDSRETERSSNILSASTDPYQSSMVEPLPVGSFTYSDPPTLFGQTGDPRGHLLSSRGPKLILTPSAYSPGYRIQAPRPRQNENFPANVSYTGGSAPFGPRFYGLP